jgi:hypothetical protein
LLVIVVMDAGLPESSIALKYRKEPFNRKWNNSGMSLAAALYWIRKTIWLFSSLWMANSWVNWCWRYWI